jgi:AcrR family transcriptional regulator
MARTDEQLAAIRERTRAKVLDAATRVFTRRGFAAASMQDIANEADISVGLIYRHFKTKEELFGAL